MSKEAQTKILEYLGVSEDTDFDTFKGEFESKFMTKEQAVSNKDIRSAVVGERMKDITVGLNKLAKSVGMESSFETLKEKGVEGSIEWIQSGVGEQLTTLKTSAKEGADKRVSDLLKKNEELEASFHQMEAARDAVQGEFETFKSEANGKFEAYKIDTMLNAEKSKIKWVDGMTDIQRSGFNSFVKDNYRFGLDGDKLVVRDTEGNMIPGKQAGSFLTPGDVLDRVATDNGLKRVNNAQPGQKRKVTVSTPGSDKKPNVSSAYEQRKREMGL